MVLLDILKNAAIRHADISDKKVVIPVNRNAGGGIRMKKTVVNDILNRPEDFEFVGYLENDELVFRARRRYVDVNKEDL